MTGPIELGPLVDHPRVSLIIPCRNEVTYIGRCLDSIVNAWRPDRLRVMVCDGMSTDGTRELVDDHARRHPWIERVDNPDRTTPHALDRGLRHAPFDVAIILGAHATIHEGFIKASIDALRGDATVGCAGGIIQNVYEDARSRRIGAAMSHPFGVGNAHFRTGGRMGYVDTVAFGAYRHEVFERVGSFDLQLIRNQDDEFNFRIVRHGLRILLDPAIRSTYFVRGTYGRLYRQYHQYGYWKVYVNRKHRTVTTVRQLVPAAWVAALLMSVISALVLWSLLPMALIIVPYLLASFVAAMKATDQWSDGPGVLVSFWVLHLAYGAGYWRGIIELLLLGRDPAEHHSSTSR
ncbi:MAG: glycosyltransferase family 2 protein [Flavobacteriales bacterium]|jgi:glycosyltransferase involved in cell wall biosynthesis|nr:glycosyltransferase family 2 protein [Flavobacteriales bacterium]